MCFAVNSNCVNLTENPSPIIFKRVFSFSPGENKVFLKCSNVCTCVRPLTCCLDKK